MQIWRLLSRRVQCQQHTARSLPWYSRAIHHRVNVAQLLGDGNAESEIEVNGWIRSVRKQKRIAFAVVSDGSTAQSIQAVLRPEHAADLSYGSAVKLLGKWQASTGKGQAHELQVSSIQLQGQNDAEKNPLQPKYQTAEFLRTIPHLRARVPHNMLLLRLRSQVIASLTRFFAENDYVQTHTPVITSSDCEGAGEVFTISSNTEPTADEAVPSASSADSTASDADQHFFRAPKYLTVSAQLHLEALAQAVSRVWTLSPTFRAERSDTPRHLSEFYMLEAETCFVDDLSEVMDLVEHMLQAVAKDLLDSRLGKELVNHRAPTAPDAEVEPTAVDLESRWRGLATGAWPRITYAEAIETLQSAVSAGKVSFTVAPTADEGLHSEHERYLTQHFNPDASSPPTPVFVTDYPAVQKPFYMLPSSKSSEVGRTVANFDLLVPDHLELAGGSLREHDPAALKQAMAERGISGEGLQWYMDLREFGSAPHGGFGLGFDRLLAYLAGVQSIRDVVGFPRWVGRCEC